MGLADTIGSSTWAALLHKYRRHIRLNEGRLEIGQHLFFGSKIQFFWPLYGGYARRTCHSWGLLHSEVGSILLFLFRPALI